MTVEQAISAIVTFHTLPPQIDYTTPFAYKAEQAEKYLRKLKLGDQHLETATKQIEEYYNSDAPYYDSLF